MPKVSVIIPCYNLGKYVEEAIDSALFSSFTDLEVIVVNDGSTDSYTNEVLRKLNKPKTRIIETDNQGVSIARNVGIKASKGEYILPLDADDVIYPEYIAKAVKELDDHKELGIVYAKGEFFGLKTGEWDLPPYSLKEMLNSNCIPVCGMFRRQDYDKIVGYNPNMIYGIEDWDFWLSLLEQGVQVKRLDEILFKYRQLRVSRSSSSRGMERITLQQLISNHLSFYMDNIALLKSDMLHLFLSKKNLKKLKKMGHYKRSNVFLARLRGLPHDIFKIIKIYLLFPIYVYRLYKQMKI